MLNIKTASLLDSVGLGDYAGRLNDYRGASCYICDAISEIADSATSIYYSDIIKFISGNVEAVNAAIKEFGWDGCGCDLYKAGQMAEYMQIEADIYSHLEDAALLLACDYLRYDLDREEIPEALAEAVKEWASEIETDHRCSWITEAISEWIEEHKEVI
jgi:hypothetical protein